MILQIKLMYHPLLSPVFLTVIRKVFNLCVSFPFICETGKLMLYVIKALRCVEVRVSGTTNLWVFAEIQVGRSRSPVPLLCLQHPESVSWLTSAWQSIIKERAKPYEELTGKCT